MIQKGTGDTVPKNYRNERVSFEKFEQKGTFMKLRPPSQIPGSAPESVVVFYFLPFLCKLTEFGFLKKLHR